MTESAIDIKSPWSVENKVVLVQLHADERIGLDTAEAARRLNAAGPNKIATAQKTSVLKILFNQFVSPFVLMLAVAAGLSFYFKEWLDGFAILAVIVINAVIGFLMEFQAERSMEALKKLTVVPARVIRDGKVTEVPSEDVVPGDILFVESAVLLRWNDPLLDFPRLTFIFLALP